MTYEPKPIDTGSVALPDGLEELVERLAENNHDTWARGRIRDGWTWGPRRDDALKQHPDLVPYADLPESEKAFDRDTVAATIRAVLVLGWEIRRGG